MHLIDRIAVEWHHEAYWVMGVPHENPNNINDPTEKQKIIDRIAIHQKYKRQYENIMWFLADSKELAEKFVNWG
jgi:hypothetical protein